MNYRNLLIASLITGTVASCSMNPKNDTSSAVPDISDSNRADLIEINASLKPPAASTDFRPASVTKPQTNITRRRVEFTIGDEGPISESQPVSASRSDTGFSGATSGPTKLAPSYPQRPVPAYGMTRQTVVATHGQPANRLAGTAGSEVWDYGTFRVFFQNDNVAFTKVW